MEHDEVDLHQSADVVKPLLFNSKKGKYLNLSTTQEAESALFNQLFNPELNELLDSVKVTTSQALYHVIGLDLEG